jgi:hypothetical protein
MRLVPESNSERIDFFAHRVQRWLEHAAELGTTPEEVAALIAEVEEAKAASKARRIARQAAMSATLSSNLATARMARRGAAIIQQVKARAGVAGNGVYVLASIDPPADPSPIAAPGTPYRFDVELLATGWLKLRWKSKNPRGSSGTTYHVERSIDGGPMAFLGVSGDRSFTDATVPAGTREVTYQVRGIRSTKAGAPARYTVALNGDATRGLPLPWRANGKIMLVAA